MIVQIMASLRRTIAVPVAMFVAAAAVGCIVRSSLSLSAPTEMAPPNHPGHRALKLVPTREIVHYHVDSKKAIGLGAELPPWWKDINYRQRGLCGGAKCFFLSSTDPSQGYLIGLPVVKDRPMFDAAAKANDYARMLESNYGIRHFFTGPPFELETPGYFSQHLRGEYVPFFKGVKSLIVQPSRTAPDGSIIVRCYGDRTLYGRLAYILRFMNRYSRQRLLGELEGAIHMVAHQPELITDFQLLIDRKGRTFHLDLDRVENPTSPKDMQHFQGCLEGAVEYVRKYKSENEAVVEGIENEAVVEGSVESISSSSRRGGDEKEASSNSISVEALEKYGQETGNPMDAQIASFFVGFFEAQGTNSISVEALEKYGQETDDPMAAQIASFFVGFFEAQAKEFVESW